MKKVLFIDDQVSEWIEILRDFLSPQGFTVVGEADPANIAALVKKHSPDIIMLDLMFGDKNLGKQALKDIKKRYPLLPVMIVTTTMDKPELFSEQDYVLADCTYFKDMLKNKDDFADLAGKLSTTILTAETKKNNIEVPSLDEEFGFIVGDSTKMKEACDIIRRVADSNATVLITGESGTGKEMIARAIVNKSSRSTGPYVTINCGAIPDNLIESELFGYEKGAFTGAAAMRPGKFELADNGTILLDEIGELPLNLQVKLLRALQEKQIDRVGGDKSIAIDVRVIAATNKNLQAETQKGNFREDLFYRLNTIIIDLPPLRERKEDIPELYALFVHKYAAESRKRISLKLRDDVLDRLKEYHWPGNIREIEKAVERAILLTNHQVLQPDDFKDLGIEAIKHDDLFGNTDIIIQKIWDGQLDWDALKKEFGKQSDKRVLIITGLIDKWIAEKGSRPKNKDLAALLKTSEGNVRQKLTECGLKLLEWK